MRLARVLALALAGLTSAAGLAWATPSFLVTKTLVVPKRPIDIAVGDLNGDGIDDIAIASKGSNKVSIVLVNPDGTFRQGVTTLVLFRQIKGIGIGDFNGDGKGDVVVVTGNVHTFVVPGNGDGTFGKGSTIRRCCPGAAVAVGDFDNSRPGAKFGDDLAITDPTRNDVNVLYDNGTPPGISFNTPGLRSTAGKRPGPIATGDFNNDGKTDIVALNVQGTGNDASVLLNTGSQSFNNLGNFFAAKHGASLTVGDFNNDGVSDLIVSDKALNAVSLVPGAGGGFFGTPSTLSIPCSIDQTTQRSLCTVQQAVVADFDGDGFADVAALISGPVQTSMNTGSTGGEVNAVLVYQGNAGGTFSDPIHFPNMGVGARILKLGNFNNDNKIDLVVGSRTDSSIRLLLNTSGQATSATNTPSIATPTRTSGTVGPVNTPTPTEPPCNGAQGCDCDPAHGDDDCNVPFFCAEIDANDGVCCDTPCDVANVSCEVPGYVGTCEPIDIPNSGSCLTDEQCTSGFCVDGVCCSTACTGSTQRCNVVPGTCTDVGTARPTATATPTPQGGNMTPTLKGLGTPCAAAGECQSTFCPPEDLVCCDSACTGANEDCHLPTQQGHCLPTNLPNGNNCIVSAQCISNDCESGVCVGAGGNPTPTPTSKKSDGEDCTDNSDCISGNCPPAAGVCCDQPCLDGNERCDLVVGSCLSTGLPDGSDCQFSQQCQSGNCVSGVCESIPGASPTFTPTRTPAILPPTPTKTITPTPGVILTLARGSGCAVGDGDGSGSSALLLVLPAWWLISTRKAAPASRRRRRN